MILSGAVQQLHLMSPIIKPCVCTHTHAHAPQQGKILMAEHRETQEQMRHFSPEKKTCVSISLCLNVGFSLISVRGIIIFHDRKIIIIICDIALLVKWG